MLNNVTSSELDAPEDDTEVPKHPALPPKPTLGSHFSAPTPHWEPAGHQWLWQTNPAISKALGLFVTLTRFRQWASFLRLKGKLLSH